MQDWKAHWKAQGQPWRTEPEIDLERQQFLQQQLDSETDKTAPFDGIPLGRADIEWLLQKYREENGDKEGNLQRLQLSKAILSAIDYRGLPLEGAGFQYAQLEGAHFLEAQLEGANFYGAQLEGANFQGAQLEGVNLSSAKMSTAIFNDATIVTNQGVGLTIADATGWDEVYLPIIEWSRIKQLGDEAHARQKRNEAGEVKKKPMRLADYRTAMRAYRQLATALEGQGLKEEAEFFAYRAAVMQRKVLWWRLRQDRQPLR